MKNLANSLYQPSKFQSATEMYKRAKTGSPEDISLVYNLRTALFDLADFFAAIKHFEVMLSKQANHILAGFNLKVCLQKLKDLSGAAVCSRKILTHNPNNVRY